MKKKVLIASILVLLIVASMAAYQLAVVRDENWYRVRYGPEPATQTAWYGLSPKPNCCVDPYDTFTAPLLTPQP